MTDKPDDISQEAWDAAEQPVWLAVHSSLPMQVEVARAIQTALSTAYRQGLEDAAKGLDLDEILGITEYLLEQAAIEWPDEGQPECDSDGLCGQRVCDEVGCVVSKYRRVRALKDNPNG